MEREIRLVRFDYEPFRPYLSDNLLMAAPTYVRSISDANAIYRDCVNMSNIGKAVMAAVADGDKILKPMFHKFYSIKKYQYTVGGDVMVDVEIIRERQPQRVYKSETKSVNRRVACVNRPSFTFRFRNGKIECIQEFSRTRDGIIDPSSAQIFEGIGRGGHIKQHYNSVLNFLIDSIFEDLYDEPVFPKVKESIAQKKRRIKREKVQEKKEARRQEKMMLEEQKAARRAEREEKRARKQFEEKCNDEIKKGLCSVVPEFDTNGQRTGKMIKIANSAVESYMAEHGLRKK